MFSITTQRAVILAGLLVASGLPLAGQTAAGPKAVAGKPTADQVIAVTQAVTALKDNEIAAQKARGDLNEALARGPLLQAAYEKAIRLLPGWCEGGQLQRDFTFQCPPPPPKKDAK